MYIFFIKLCVCERKPVTRRWVTFRVRAKKYSTSVNLIKIELRSFLGKGYLINTRTSTYLAILGMSVLVGQIDNKK